MAEQVAEAIKEAILADQWQSGEALPTEPELSAQFGVSRAVIRDATRMLAAQGLVEAQHGKGVFVTNSQVEAFGDALLLALRRAGATVWDVEHFEQVIYPEVCALASQEATDEELTAIRAEIEHYLAVYAEILVEEQQADGTLTKRGKARFAAAYRPFIQAIFAATHNQVFTLLAQPLVRLRSLRNWQDEDAETVRTVEDMIALEAAYMHQLIDTIASRDPAHVRTTIAAMMALPAEAITAMRQTPIGEVPVIPLVYPH